MMGSIGSFHMGPIWPVVILNVPSTINKVDDLDSHSSLYNDTVVVFEVLHNVCQEKILI